MKLIIREIEFVQEIEIRDIEIWEIEFGILIGNPIKLVKHIKYGGYLTPYNT